MQTDPTEPLARLILGRRSPQGVVASEQPAGETVRDQCWHVSRRGLLSDARKG